MASSKKKSGKKPTKAEIDKHLPELKSRATEGEIVQPTPEPDAEQQQPAANDTPTTDLATVDNASLAIIGGVSTETLKNALQVQTEQRKLIKDFIQSHLEDGVDYGKIHVVNRDKCPDSYNCKKDYHYSKAVLFKPGQEKLFSLFQITSELERDEETYTMLPNMPGLVAYKCVMFRNGQKVGEGRGSAVVGDNRRDTNATIKIAEKRARMDACLSLGFSEYFAQDLDDPDYKSQAEMANQQAAARAEARDKDEFGLFPRDPKLPIDNNERQVLFNMILKQGISKDDVVAALKANGVNDPANLTSGQARNLMGLIKTNIFAAPEVVVDEPIVDESDSQDQATATPYRPPVQEADLVVDDELKAFVNENYNQIGFNARGRMWFMKYVTGRPFGKFETFTEAHWRKSFDLINDILDVRVPVDPAYMVDAPDEQTTMDYSQPSNTSEKEDAELEGLSQVFGPGVERISDNPKEAK